MNITLKNKVLFALFSGLTFAILNSLTNYFFLSNEFSWVIFNFNFIFFGFFFGFGFLYIMSKLYNRQMKKIKIEMEENEMVKHQGLANLFRGIEGVGGKLLLTNRRLVFKPHKLNIQSGETILNLNDIKEVIPRKSAKLFQNGIRVFNQKGEHLDFVIFEREKWISKISTAMNAPQQQL